MRCYYVSFRLRLESENYSRYYVGYYPKSISERFEKHNSGKVISTKAYKPWRLIFYEAYLNKNDAFRRERYLKTSQGMKMLKLMLKEYRESNNRILLPGETRRVVKFDRAA